MAVQWPTLTINGNYNRKGLSPTSGDGLETAVRQWPTPDASVSRGNNQSDSPGATVRHCLARAAELYGPQDPPPTGVGSTQSSGRRRLNPKFAEWLMGFPSEHTAANAKPDYERWETQCHHLLPQWLGGFSCDEP